MKQITYFTDDPNQKLTVILDDGSRALLSLRYSTNQQGWFYTLSYNDFIVSNRRLVASPNLLRAFKNLIPFGIACVVTDGYEPVFLSDFITSRANIYVLNSDDVAVVEDTILNRTT